MKLSEAKLTAKSDPNVKLINIRKKIEVTTTELHPRGAGKVSRVPEHMIEHLVKKGMIVDPDAKKTSKKEKE
jgi:hypothetical protein